MPRGPVTKQFHDADESLRPAPAPRKQRAHGPARESLERPLIEPVDNPKPKAWMDAMAFNEEEVEIIVHDTTDKNAHPLPDVYVNGRAQRFVRGKKQTVRRKFVEALARSVMTTYTQQKVKDDNGDETYIQVGHNANVFPFSLVNPTAKDQQWLDGIMRERAA